jgi:quinolinate synthase
MREMIAEMMGPTLERTEYSKELVLTNNDLVHKLRVELTDLRSDFQKVTIKDFELMRTNVLEKLHERFQQQAHEFINLQGKLKEEYNKNFSKIQDVE